MMGDPTAGGRDWGDAIELERTEASGPGPMMTGAVPGFPLLEFATARDRLDAFEAAMEASAPPSPCRPPADLVSWRWRA